MRAPEERELVSHLATALFNDYRLVGVVVAMRQHMGLPTILPSEEFAANVALQVFGRAVSSVMALQSGFAIPKRTTDFALKAFRRFLWKHITN